MSSVSMAKMIAEENLDLTQEEVSVDLDQIAPLDPIAYNHGKPIALAEFWEFIDANGLGRAEKYHKNELLDHLRAYHYYLTLEEQAILQEIDKTQESKAAFSIFKALILADMAREEALTLPAEAQIALKDQKTFDMTTDEFLFYLKHQHPRLTIENLEEDEESRAMIVESYKEMIAYEELAQKSGMDQLPDYQREYQFAKMFYLAQKALAKYLEDNPITETMLEAAFEDWLQEGGHNLYKVSHIYIEDQALANQLLKQINDGEILFSEAVEKYSIDIQSQKYGGAISNGNWVNFMDKSHPFANAVMGANIGDIYPEVVAGVMGNYHIIRLDDKKADSNVTLEDERWHLEQKLQQEALEKLYQSFDEHYDLELNL